MPQGIHLRLSQAESFHGINVTHSSHTPPFRLWPVPPLTVIQSYSGAHQDFLLLLPYGGGKGASNDTCRFAHRSMAMILAIMVFVIGMPRPASAAGEELPGGAHQVGLTLNGQSLSHLLSTTAGTERSLGVLEQPLSDGHGLGMPDTRSGRSSDWEAVRRLGHGARVVVLTSLNQSVRGRVSTVSSDMLGLVDRQGGNQALRLEDVREVRLDHRFSTAQYVGLGLLVGGVTGLAIGRASECDCNLRGLATAMGGLGGVVMGTFVGWGAGRGVNARPGRLVYRNAES